MTGHGSRLAYSAKHQGPPPEQHPTIMFAAWKPQAIFKDRHDAGKQCSTQFSSTLRDFDIQAILALPRGGCITAQSLAETLGVPIYSLPIRRLGIPGDIEWSMGALSLLDNEATTWFDERIPTKKTRDRIGHCRNHQKGNNRSSSKKTSVWDTPLPPKRCQLRCCR